MVSDTTPRVRVVVVNWNGGDMVVRCVEHLLATEWPATHLRIVVVDNGSADGSAEVLEQRFPAIEVRRTHANLGFAGGCNAGMRDIDGVDAVALINSDAFVEPGWLRPLAAELDDPAVGAANAKVMFEPVFVEVRVGSETFVPSSADTRTLGVRVSGVEVDGVDVFGKTHFRTGFHPREQAEAEGAFHWSTGDGVVWVPIPPDVSLPSTIRVRLAAEREKKVELVCGPRGATAVAGTEPIWVEVAAEGPGFDVLNNVGSLMVDGGYGADRGYWERDDGQHDEAEDVMAWCGCAVLLSTRYLRDVGIFDDDYFGYYEDFDLSWRGRARGWRYRYAPESRVRHRHAASHVEGSSLFDHYVQRNRLLTLVKNAPAGMAAREVATYGGAAARLVWGEVVSPTLRRQPRRPLHSVRRLRSGAGFLRRLPHAVQQRREIARARTVPAPDLVSDRVTAEEWFSQPGHG